MRKEAHQWINVLAKSKYEYIAEYRQRIQEVENNQKELWKLYYDHRSSYELKRQCQIDLAKLSSMLMDMYDAMPIVNEIVRRRITEKIDDNKFELTQPGIKTLEVIASFPDGEHISYTTLVDVKEDGVNNY